MRVLVFGATGGTGKQLVQQALDQGHDMTAFARDPRKVTLTHSRLRVGAGDVLRAESVDAAMAGQDAVVSALDTRLPLKILIPIIVASQIVVRTVALTQPVELFVELGCPSWVLRLPVHDEAGPSPVW